VAEFKDVSELTMRHDRSTALQLPGPERELQHFISKHDSPDKMYTDGDQSLHETTERLS